MTERSTPESSYKESSEFGQGLTYCLGLFLAHAERARDIKNSYSKIGLKYQDMWPEIWFNGAADHLFDLVIPSTLSEGLQNRLKNFQSKCLHCRLCLEVNAVTEEDVKWAIQEAKDLLRMIDQEYGIETIQGQWE